MPFAEVVFIAHHNSVCGGFYCGTLKCRIFVKRHLRKLILRKRPFNFWLYVGSSTETVAFQVHEILKTDHEFLQFFLNGIENISV